MATKTKAPELPVINFESQKKWEDWLKKNYTKSPGLWLRMYKKGTGIKSIDYAQALDVALCYGWIDGQKDSYDEESWLQKFTPRGPKSVWSKKNTEHIARLIKDGKMQPAGLAVVEAAKKDGRWDRAYEGQSKATLPQDFLDALEKNKKAKAFFATLNKTNTYAIFYRIQHAKKQETRERKIKEFVAMLARGEKLH
jgi:uncharacterized protein YdeI (YjbR/CyaY-like superfamily)